MMNRFVQNLDGTIQRYLKDHNAAQQSLIYLANPYRGVGLFSLFVAFLLDIAAFIIGVIIDRVSSRHASEQENVPAASPKQEAPEEDIERTEQETVWSVVLGLNRYIFLTGDYAFSDGVMTYKAIEGGEEITLEHQNKNLAPGFYKVENQQIYPVEPSLLFIQGGKRRVPGWNLCGLHP